MNPVWLQSIRVVIVIAVCPFLWTADSAKGAETDVAAVECDSLPGLTVSSLGDSTLARGLEPEPNDRPAAKMTLRKVTRRVSQPRPVGRLGPAASLAPMAGHHPGRPRHVPAVRLTAAADLPRFCRWLL